MTDVDVEHRESGRRFVARTPSGLAFVSYVRPDDGTIELQHTVVPRADRGRGIGSALVRTAVSYARDQGLRVVPTCPFVKAWFEKNPGERDVVG